METDEQWKGGSDDLKKLNYVRKRIVEILKIGLTKNKDEQAIANISCIVVSTDYKTKVGGQLPRSIIYRFIESYPGIRRLRRG